ncbi:hypothetical protein HBH89_182700 [Parastagonospora nodorum]|nr:hypothetical protein HBH89_182700 [Parastagonospora nodorum]
MILSRRSKPIGVYGGVSTLYLVRLRGGAHLLQTIIWRREVHEEPEEVRGNRDYSAATASVSRQPPAFRGNRQHFAATASETALSSATPPYRQRIRPAVSESALLLANTLYRNARHRRDRRLYARGWEVRSRDVNGQPLADADANDGQPRHSESAASRDTNDAAQYNAWMQGTLNLLTSAQARSRSLNIQVSIPEGMHKFSSAITTMTCRRDA